MSETGMPVRRVECVRARVALAGVVFLVGGAATWAPPAGAGVEYVVVCHPELEAAAMSFAAHRANFDGNCYRTYDVEVQTTAWIDDQAEYETDANSLTKEEIKAFLRDRYDDGDLRYVLLMGTDFEGGAQQYPFVPSMAVAAPQPVRDYRWDDWYVCFDGPSDVVPNVPIGRVGASSIAAANAIVQKIVAHDTDDWRLPSGVDWRSDILGIGLDLDMPAGGGIERGEYVAAAFRQLEDEWLPESMNECGYGNAVGLASMLGGYEAREEFVFDGLERGAGWLFALGTVCDEHRLVRFLEADEFAIEDLPSSGARLPFLFAASCNVAQCVTQGGVEDGVLNSLMRAPAKGVVGAIAPTGGVLQSSAIALMKDFVLLRRQRPDCGEVSAAVGDVLLDAKQKWIELGTGSSHTFRQFRVEGDPALRVPMRMPSVSVDRMVMGSGVSEAGRWHRFDASIVDSMFTLPTSASDYRYIWRAPVGGFYAGSNQWLPEVESGETAFYSCRDCDPQVVELELQVIEDGYACNSGEFRWEHEVILADSGGCPIVQAKPYGQWIDVNSVLSNRVYAASVETEDFVHVDPPVAATPMFQLRITESDPANFTLLDFAELQYVDRPISSSMEISPKGTPYEYDTWTNPDSVWLALGVAVTSDLAEVDSLQLTVADGDTVYAVFSDDSGPTRVGLPGLMARNKPLLLQQDLSGQGEWGLRMLPEYGVGTGEPLLPRRDWAPAFADSPLVVRGDGLADTVAWSVGELHQLDSVFLLDGAEEWPTVTTQALVSAVHSDSGNVTSYVNADDNQYLRVDHGQYVTLSFSYPAVPSGYKREMILHLKGTYEHITAPFTSDPIAGFGLPWGFQGVFPNPTTGRTRVNFKANGQGKCRLAVYDVGGRCIRTLMDEPGGQAALVQTEWDGYDDRGKRVASGVYFIRLQEGKEQQAEKLVVLR